MEGVRQEANRQLAPTLSDAAWTVALDAIDATIYQPMALIDGRDREAAQQPVQHRPAHDGATSSAEEWWAADALMEQRDLRKRDRMCIGVYGWMRATTASTLSSRTGSPLSPSDIASDHRSACSDRAHGVGAPLCRSRYRHQRSVTSVSACSLGLLCQHD
jgi:hypothetical protein